MLYLPPPTAASPFFALFNGFPKILVYTPKISRVAVKNTFASSVAHSPIVVSPRQALTPRISTLRVLIKTLWVKRPFEEPDGLHQPTGHYNRLQYSTHLFESHQDENIKISCFLIRWPFFSFSRNSDSFNEGHPPKNCYRLQWTGDHAASNHLFTNSLTK